MNVEEREDLKSSSCSFKKGKTISWEHQQI